MESNKNDLEMLARSLQELKTNLDRAKAASTEELARRLESTSGYVKSIYPAAHTTSLR